MDSDPHFCRDTQHAYMRVHECSPHCKLLVFLVGSCTVSSPCFQVSDLNNVLKCFLICYRSKVDFDSCLGRPFVKTTSDFAAMCIFCVRDETESWDIIQKRNERCGTECTPDSVDSVRVNQHHMNLVHMGGCGLMTFSSSILCTERRGQSLPFEIFRSSQVSKPFVGGVFLHFLPDCWRFRTKLCAQMLFLLQQCQVVSVFHGGVPLPFIRAKFCVRTFAPEKN